MKNFYSSCSVSPFHNQMFLLPLLVRMDQIGDSHHYIEDRRSHLSE